MRAAPASALGGPEPTDQARAKTPVKVKTTIVLGCAGVSNAHTLMVELRIRRNLGPGSHRSLPSLQDPLQEKQVQKWSHL